MRTLFLLALTACAPTLSDGFVDRLTDRGGCGDVLFFAVDTGDTILLEVRADGLLAEATASGEPVQRAATLPDDDIVLTVELGTRVSDATCDDVIENGGPRVARTLVAVSGTATITATPSDDGDEATADLRLDDVVVGREDGSGTVRLGDLEIRGVTVGWFAG